MPGARRRGRPHTSWTDIKTWTNSQWKSLSEWQDSDKWRKYVHGVANPRIETAKEQNRKVFQHYYKLDIVLVNNQAVSTHSVVKLSMNNNIFGNAKWQTDRESD